MANNKPQVSSQVPSNVIKPPPRPLPKLKPGAVAKPMMNRGGKNG